jgi:hypothetical protein
MRHDLWCDLRRVQLQIDMVIRYEAGELSHDEEIVLFQLLIDSGLAWSLRPNYAQTAAELIDLGVCHHVTRTMRKDDFVRSSAELPTDAT